MGTLTIPASGPVYLDTNCFIYSALHAATALASTATLFITNDPGFRQVSNLPMIILSDINS